MAETVELKKKKGMKIHTTSWVNLKNIMLSERSQSQHVTYYTIFHLYEMFRIRQFIAELISGCLGLE